MYIHRWFSPVGFLLALACFALPFVGWRTWPAPIIDVTYRGIDLVGGSTGAVTLVSGYPDRPWRDATIARTLPAIAELRPLAVAALALVILGVALSALPWRRIRAIATTATASAAACLTTILVYDSSNVPTPFMYFTKAVSHTAPSGALLAFAVLLAVVALNLGHLVRSLRVARLSAESQL